MIDGDPPDDRSISDDFVLLRRIAPSFYVLKDGRPILSSGAFNDPPDGSSMSVHVLEKLAELGLDAVNVIDGHDGYGLVALTAGQFRDEGFGIVWVPDVADGVRGQAHAEVHCKKTPGKRKRLREGCRHLTGPLAVTSQPYR